jgi:hypothetical protein
MLALLAAMAQGGGAVRAQVDADPAGTGQNAPTTPRAAPAQRPYSATQQNAGAQPYAPRTAPAAAGAQNANRPPAASNTDENQPAEEEMPHITIATPAPAPSPWPWQERIAWGANIGLVIFGYVGILFALRLLNKVDRQTQYAETAAQAAAYSAQAALLHAQAIMRSERPWLLVTVEPSGRIENRFMVMATNRGRGPARILSSVDKITTEVDQTSLPEEPELEDAETNSSLASVVLLPGESTGIRSFGRDEVKDFCGSDEMLARIEKWEEVILLYGKIAYENLVGASEDDPCETMWCCWYIHGRQNSGMVMAGPPAYNRHT